MRWVWVLGLLCGGVEAASVASVASPPLKLSVVSSVRLAPEVFRLGQRLRIRNLSSGAQVVIPIDKAQPYVSVDVLSRLVNSPDQEWLPEFSVLASASPRQQSSPYGVLPQALRVHRSILESRGSAPDFKSPAANSSDASLRWRVLGYRLLKAPSGLAYLEVSERVRNVFIRPEEAARRLQAKEQRNISRLFELAWRAMAIERYDLGREAFENIRKREAFLDAQQKAQLYLGLGTSSYHLEGCNRRVDEYLIEADRDVQNRDDVSYFRALCLMAKEEYKDAEVLFKELAEKKHPGYGEASSFYLGVIAETDERFDDAEAAYLDTIDFSSDSSLVTLAQQRLENVRTLQQIHSYDTKWITGGLSLSGTYDSNVVALPSDLSPSDYGLNKASSFLASSVAFLTLTPPWSRSFTHSLSYNFLLNKHFDKGLASNYDSNTHDLGTQVQFYSSAFTSHAMGYSWTRVWLGPLGSSEENLRSHSAFYLLRNFLGPNPSQPQSILDFTLRYLAIRPIKAPFQPERDLKANGVSLSTKYTRRSDFPHVHGPEASIEYRPAKGRENSLWDFKLGGFWDYTFNGGRSAWYINQSGSFSYKPYYQSSSNRHDYNLYYTGALGRNWDEGFDMKLQFQGNLNFSTLKRSYQYQQASISLLVTAYF
jgi:hypothetical protein